MMLPVLKLLVAALSLGAADALQIISTEEKSCKVTTDKGKIDLSPIANTDSPKFRKPVQGYGGPIYLWNPCNNFNAGTLGDCKNVEICQQNGRYTNLIGTKDKSQFAAVGDKLILKYTDFTYYPVKIELICGNSDVDDFEVGTSEDDWNWNLTSRHCCFPKSATILSVGTILCITLLVVLVVYLIVGGLYMKIAKQANGKELCPNYPLWVTVPGYVKDGLSFVFLKRLSSSSSAEYDKL